MYPVPIFVCRMIKSLQNLEFIVAGQRKFLYLLKHYLHQISDIYLHICKIEE